MNISIRAACAALAMAGANLVCAIPAEAAVVRLAFDGAFFDGGPGQPYHFEMVYDTSRDTSNVQALIGETVGNGLVAGNDFYGYSRSGIVSAQLSTQGITWTPDDLLPYDFGAGFAADIFFDTDIAVADPRKALLVFYSGGPALWIGGQYSIGLGGPRSVYLIGDNSTLFRDGEESFGTLSMTREVLAGEVPEPATLGLLSLGLAALVARQRRKGPCRGHGCLHS